MKALVAIAVALTLGGCATDGHTPWQASGGKPANCAKLESDQELSLNLADDMSNEGRLHASLANLQGLPDNPQVRLRKARVLRLLGRSEAEPLYRSLLGSCMAAEGEHGLGQIAAAKGNNELAISHLQRAEEMAPTDDKIRNDLGVVYLNQLRLEEARFEFLTAMELKPTDSLAALNMVTLLIYQNNWQQAALVASRANLSTGQVSKAQARATQLASPGKAPAKVKDQVTVAIDPAPAAIK
jgi:Flp pilus assembly protein TadD